jgi:hypothetical protein
MESYYWNKKINLKLKFSPFEIRKARIKMSFEKFNFEKLSLGQLSKIYGGEVCPTEGSNGVVSNLNKSGCSSSYTSDSYNDATGTTGYQGCKWEDCAVKPKGSVYGVVVNNSSN